MIKQGVEMKIFNKYQKNPILQPRKDLAWEAKAVLNAAAIKVGGEIKLIYRAIGQDGISRLGLAVSQDGYNFERFDKPLLEPEQYNEFEVMGIEDPRICYFDEEYHLVYVAASLYPPNHPHPVWATDRPWRVRVSLARTKDFKNFERDQVVIDELDSKDGALFPERINDKIHLLHREYPNICMCSGETWYRWDDNKVIAGPREGMWDNDRIGAGPSPIRTPEGWLLIYHGVDEQHVYRQGAMLLDLNDPSKVIARSQEPFLEPEEDYEKNGVVDNVTFSCGMIEKDGELIIYYGAADRVLCAGTLKINELLASLEPVKAVGAV